MSLPRLIVDDAAALAARSTERVLTEALRAIATRGRFSLALSGGSTPKALYRQLGDLPGALDWSKVDVFFGDERCVAPDHADSNYRMAKEALFDRVPLPAENIRRIQGEISPADAARAYDALVGAYLGQHQSFDLVLLGMGADGHTASLFPGTSALSVQDAWVTSTYVEKLKAHRVTLTAKALLRARAVVFLIGGADKTETLKAVLEGPAQPEVYPSQLIFRSQGPVEMYLDRAAAAKLA
jgi:6-phosphogluconolactonase